MPRDAMPSGIIERVETIGDRIRIARVAAKLGNNELDELIGKKSGYTSRLETGARASAKPDTLRKIAEATKVSFMWLTFGSGGMEDPTGRIRAATIAGRGVIIIQL